jgi:hypothetical protein
MRPLHRFAVSLACLASLMCAAVFSGPSRAHAQATTAERETARSLMDEGDAFKQAGDLEHALDRYRAAHAIMRVPTTGLEVARTQAALNHLVDATTTAIEVANSAPGSHEPELFAKARAEAGALVESLRPRVPSLTLKIEPIGVIYELRIDSVLVPEGAHGHPFKLDPGEHTILVQAPGYKAWSEPIVIAESQRIERRIDLVSTKPPPRLEAPQPFAAPRKVSGSNIALRYQQAELDADTAARTRGYVALGTGGAVLVAGIVTGIAAVSLSEDAKDRCSGKRCPASAEPAIDRANTLANVSNVTLALGVLGLGYGIFEILTHTGETAEAARREGPEVAVSIGSVAIRGRL